MLKLRLAALEQFHEIPLPSWGPKEVQKLDLKSITYYSSVSEKKSSWSEVPKNIRETFEKLGIPQAEKEMLAGAGSQYESEVIYHNLKKEWEEKGVIFMDMETALKKHEKLVRDHFMKLIPTTEHKFAALHGAVWSGGTFLYVPKGVSVSKPMQAYFRMNRPGMGQFEHTLIVIDRGAQAHYIEGCSAPKYGRDALHAGCVEVFVEENARMRYSSVENWSKDTFNLNSKRALVKENGLMEWVGGNMGSKITMLYPCSILAGRGARCDHLGIAFAGENQTQDTGAKVIHAAPETTSRVLSRSLAKNGGKTVFRSLISILPKADNCISDVRCDTLILDEKSSSVTLPKMNCKNAEASMTHEALAGKIREEDIFFLKARGMKEEEAKAMIVNGFIEPIIKSLPLEYAVEMNRLIDMEIHNAIA